jgi:pimeloyl-ACP methyl ester carboxylesterase
MWGTAAEEVRVHTPTSELAVFVHDGEHETVLLLHGGPGVPDYLEPVASLLAPGRRAARFDQRGVGKSVALNGSYGIGDYIADVDGIRNYLGWNGSTCLATRGVGSSRSCMRAPIPTGRQACFCATPPPG